MHRTPVLRVLCARQKAGRLTTLLFKAHITHKLTYPALVRTVSYPEGMKHVQDPEWCDPRSWIGRDLLPDMPSFIRRVCSGYAPQWGGLQTPSV
jgi:hypothetical protein